MNKSLLFFLLIVFVYSCKEEEKPVTALDDLDTRVISSLVFDNAQTLWIGTDSGLYRKVEEGYEPIPYKLQAGITSLSYEAAEDRLWVGTENGLAMLDLSADPPAADSIPVSNLSNPAVRSAYSDATTGNWFGTDFGITLSDDGTWQKEKFKKNLSGTLSNLPFESFRINSIGAWEGSFFFATAGFSLYRTFNWDEEADAFTGATQWLYPYNGFAMTDTMNVVFIDSEGNQWFGGQEGIQVHTGNDPKMNNTSFYDELVNPVIQCIAESPDGRIWAGTPAGISVYDGTSWVVKNENLPDRDIRAITFDAAGKAYIGTAKGIHQIAGDE